ncbi:MAG: hypothetical protein GEU88_14570 [Solirubrobacterales bacterium]|nr:hypothetical protein [Solirubrobacterales bacterium]
MNRTKAGLSAALGAALVAVALSLPSSASAAWYRVVQCTPDFPSAPDAQPFAANMGPALNNYCDLPAEFRGLYAYGQDAGAPHPQHAQSGWQFSAPAATQFVRASALTRGASQNGVFPEIHSGDRQWANTGGDMPPVAAWLGWNGEGGPAPAIQFRVRCAVSPNCGPSGSAYINAQQLAFTLDDTAAPTIGPLGGPLLEPGPQRSLRGTVAVDVAGSDAGSGLSLAYVDAYGKRLATGGYGCDVTADGQGRRLMPCPLSPGRSLAVDTADAAFHTGLNRLTLCVADFAGQPACTERDARIDNACPAAGAVVGLQEVRFKGAGAGRKGPGKKATQIIRYGRRAKLVGRAVDGAGNPVPGAVVCIGHHLIGEAYAPEEVNWTKTGRSGRFRFKLEQGPSKDYRIVAWSGQTPNEHFRTLLVRAKPRLQLDPRRRVRAGKRVSLEVVLNQPAPPGVRVKLKAKASGGWTGVPRCDGTANAAGRFGCAFEFPRSSAGARYRFKAVVPKQDGYRYLRGRSRAKSIKVHR